MTFTASAAVLAWISVIAFPLLVQAAAAAAAPVHARLFSGCYEPTLHASLTWPALSQASRSITLLPHTRLRPFHFFSILLDSRCHVRQFWTPSFASMNLSVVLIFLGANHEYATGFTADAQSSEHQVPFALCCDFSFSLLPLRLPSSTHPPIPPRSLQNNDIKEPVISALLPLLSTRTALRTIELVHCCHQDDGLRVSSSASAHAATQPAVASSCWGNIFLLSQLLLLKNVSIRFNFQK